jgi:imidazolonepropionase-like amidohydrolase
MNIRTALLALTLLASTAPAQDLALVGATVHDGTGGPVIEDAVILIEDERITCIGSRVDCATTDQFEVVDLTGRHVAPGLVDGHVHYAQTGWLDGRPDSRIGTDHYDYDALQVSLRENPQRWNRAYLCSGITAVYDVGGLPWTVADLTDSGLDMPGPHRRAAGPLITHYEPVFSVLSANGESTFLPMDSDEAARRSVAALVEMGAEAVKLWYLDPPEAQREALDARVMLIGRLAEEAGLPLLVHATELRNAKVALRAGAHMLVHSVEDAPIDAEFLDLMRESETFYAPTLIVSENWRQAVASARLRVPAPALDDPNDCVDAETRRVIGEAPTLIDEAPSRQTVGEIFEALVRLGTQHAVLEANLKRVAEAGLPVVTSTDAGNPLTLHGPSIYAEMEAMEAAGLSPSEILVMSTRNGAASMGRLDDFGTLESGKLADLIVLEADPAASASAYRSITHVMRAGDLAPVTEYSTR